MAALSDEVKLFIVRALAQFDTPSQVSEAVKEEFGLDVPRQQCEGYNPEKAAAKHLARKWREIFAATREAFLKDVAVIPIANRSYRLRQLSRLQQKAERSRNIALAAQLLEQAAKEVGDMYVNRPRGGSGGPDGEGEPAAPVQVVVNVTDARKRPPDDEPVA
jgi:hypothetical protein